jgi:ATP-dependent Clp protease ATP-binding subunit ClpA
MFERFTTEARQVVTQAQTDAREVPHGCVGTEHLLMALAAQPSATGAVLTGHGLTRDAVAAAIVAHTGGDELDAEALSTLGIDLDAVRSTVEEVFGPGALGARPRPKRGHIPFTPRAKKVLELSLREALAMGSRTISDGHIALGLLREGEGLAMRVIADRGVDPARLRDEIRLTLAS